MTVFAPASVVNGLPVNLHVQLRVFGEHHSSSSLSSSSLIGSASGSGSDVTAAREHIVEDFTLPPAGSFDVHYSKSSKVEVRY
jgi:hypothetical protein